MDIQEFADLFYEENNYGVGDEHDGMILAVDMDSRQWSISTTGKGIQVLTEAALDIMEQQIVELMSEGDFYNAFTYSYSLIHKFLIMQESVLLRKCADFFNKYIHTFNILRRKIK